MAQGVVVSGNERVFSGIDGARHRLAVDSGTPLSPPVVAWLAKIIDDAEDNPDEVVVLNVGGDADAAAGEPFGGVDVHLVSKWERALRRLEESPAVVIVTASGRCSGLALDVLLAGDHRIGTADLQVSFAADSGLIWPGMAIYRLANHVGVARARRLALFGATVSGEHAAQAGIVDEIVEDRAGLDRAVKEAATLLGPFAGAELAIRRRLLMEATTAGFQESLGVHLAACDRVLRRRHEDRDA
jgi:isomerase DpgB